MNEKQIRLTSILRAPVVSEKSSIVADSANQFVFKVEKTATKLEVKQAVELMFSVKVDAVRVCNVKGKTKRFGRAIGKRSDWKKAYVKLAVGQNIELASA